MGKRGLFVTLEGGEGAGKSTLAASLEAYAESAGIRTCLTREPGGTPTAEKIRNIVLHSAQDDSLSHLTSALLMSAARSDHLEKRIMPALERGELVICDRFSDSTRVYQSVDGGLSADTLKALETITVRDYMPELTVILDADPEALVQRRAARDDAPQYDVYEARELAFHREVRNGFLEIAKREPHRCAVIDALRPAAEIADQVWRLIRERTEDTP